MAESAHPTATRTTKSITIEFCSDRAIAAAIWAQLKQPEMRDLLRDIISLNELPAQGPPATPQRRGGPVPENPFFGSPYILEDAPMYIHRGPLLPLDDLAPHDD